MRPLDDLARGLANTRKSMGDGTLGGRSRIATPYDPRRLRRATLAVTGGGAGERLGEAIYLTGTVTVPAGGGPIVSQLDTILAQAAFTSVSAAGDGLTLAVRGSWHVDVDVRWTDGYRGGGTLVTTLDGTATPEVWPGDGPWNRWADDLIILADRGQDLDLEIAADDGAEHDAEITVSVALVEPLRTVQTNPEVTPKLYAVHGGLYSFDFGTGTWTNHGRPQARNDALLNTELHYGAFSGSAIVCVAPEDGTVHRTTNPLPSGYNATEDTGGEDWTIVLDRGSGSNLRGIATDNVGTWVIVEVAGAAGESQVWRSTDDGVTWTNVATVTGVQDAPSLGNPAAALVDVECDRAGLWTIGGGDRTSLWYSTDAGATWTEFTYAPLLDYDLQTSAPVPFGGDRIFIGEMAGLPSKIWEFDLSDLSAPAHIYDASGAGTYGASEVARSPDGAQIVGISSTGEPGRYVVATPGGGTVTGHTIDNIASRTNPNGIGHWTTVGDYFAVQQTDGSGLDPAVAGVIYTDDLAGNVWTLTVPPKGGQPYSIFAHQTA